MANRFQSLALISIGLILLACGSYLVYSDLTAASAWKTSTARITSSSVIDSSDDEGSSFFPDVIYTYSIEGKEHSGHCCSYGANNREAILKIMEAYKPGSEIDIAYDPQDPSRSKMKSDLKALDPFNTIIAVSGGALLLLGIFFLSQLSRSSQSAQ